MSIFHDVHNVICLSQTVHELSTVPPCSYHSPPERWALDRGSLTA